MLAPINRSGLLFVSFRSVSIPICVRDIGAVAAAVLACKSIHLGSTLGVYENNFVVGGTFRIRSELVSFSLRTARGDTLERQKAASRRRHRPWLARRKRLPAWLTASVP